MYNIYIIVTTEHNNITGSKLLRHYLYHTRKLNVLFCRTSILMKLLIAL